MEKVKTVGNKKIFNNPVDDKGNPYWIPIVVKNKSYLIGYVNAYQNISEIYDIDSNDLNICLSSDKFNDIMIDGTRIKNLTRKELKDKLRKLFFTTNNVKHPENDISILDDCILSISCPHCGMFYSWKTEKEIPNEDSFCVTCGKAIIIYTGVYDTYFDFDGKDGDVNKIFEEIRKENEN